MHGKVWKKHRADNGCNAGLLCFLYGKEGSLTCCRNVIGPYARDK